MVCDFTANLLTAAAKQEPFFFFSFSKELPDLRRRDSEGTRGHVAGRTSRFLHREKKLCRVFLPPPHRPRKVLFVWAACSREIVCGAVNCNTVF